MVAAWSRVLREEELQQRCSINLPSPVLALGDVLVRLELMEHLGRSWSRDFGDFREGGCPHLVNRLRDERSQDLKPCPAVGERSRWAPPSPAWSGRSVSEDEAFGSDVVVPKIIDP
jgi:hypothetical protein